MQNLDTAFKAEVRHLRTRCTTGGPRQTPQHGGDDPTDIGALGKGKDKARRMSEGCKDNKTRTRTCARTQSNDGTVEKRGRYSKDCWSKEDHADKGGSKGKRKKKNTKDAHNLDATKPANTEQEVGVGGFDLSQFNVNVVGV